MNLLLVISCSVGAAVTTFFIVWAVKGLAKRHMLDIPNPRSSHRVPTPRGGGIGIFLVLLTAWLAAGHFYPIPWGRVLYQAACFLLVGIVGWIDDVRSLPSLTRFLVHSAAALIAMDTWGWWDAIMGPNGTVHLGIIGPPVTFLWIVGLLNAYNFMDGIDGLAGLQGVVAGCAWSAVGIVYDTNLCLFLGALVAGSCIGFLIHNWPPASIFMGDVGSTFLGYTLGVIALLERPLLLDEGIALRLPELALCFVWPFVFDTTFTFIRRALRREQVFSAHRSHLYQRLVASGFSHRQVTLLYGAVASVVSFSGIWEAWTSSPPRLSLFFMVATAALLVFMTRSAEEKAKSEVRPLQNV